MSTTSGGVVHVLVLRRDLDSSSFRLACSFEHYLALLSTDQEDIAPSTDLAAHLRPWFTLTFFTTHSERSIVSALRAMC